MAYTLEDVEDKLLTRLAVCYAEITGVNRVYETPPETISDDGVLPMMYTLIGPMLENIPNASPGHVIVGRIYTARLLVSPFSRGTDAGLQGARANKLARPFYSRVRNYFLKHPRLDTEGVNVAALGEFGTIWQDVLVMDNGLEPMPGPGSSGQVYSGIDFDITIRVKVRTSGLS